MKFPGSLIYQGFRQALRNPRIRPWIMLGIFVYLLSPIDLVPSLLPVLGEVDDLVLVGILLSELLQIWAGDPFTPQRREPAPGSQASEPPASTMIIDIPAKSVDQD